MSVGAALGLLAAAGVPLLLLLTWGHVNTSYFVPGQAANDTSRAFDGSALPAALRIELLALSGVVVAIAVVAILRPIPRAALLLCCAAMALEVVLIGIEAYDTTLFSSELGAPNVVSLHFSWASATLVAALSVSGVGIALWLGMFVVGASGTKCPDLRRTGAARRHRLSPLRIQLSNVRAPAEV